MKKVYFWGLISIALFFNVLPVSFAEHITIRIHCWKGYSEPYTGQFLELVKKYVNLHVHPYHGMSPDNDEVKLDVLRYDLDSILNKNINTN